MRSGSLAKDCSMRNVSFTGRRLVLAVVCVAVLASLPGCGALATVAWLIQGPPKTPAKFRGLENKRVAVVCLDANSLSGPGGEADAIGRAVNVSLGYNVPNINMVRPAEVADWIDSKNEDVTDYRAVGRGVKADMVVGIDLVSFSIHEGQTLLKGRAKVGVKVYDM